jgi:ankyrin repeat protein
VECVEEILGRVARGCGFKYKVSRQPGIENAITAAVLEWRVEVLRLLIAAPEFTHSAKVLDRSLLSLACSYNLDQYHLLNRVKKDTSEGQAMQVQVYGILLECGANVNATQTYEDGSSDNLTVLHLICRASRTPRKELWEMLLEYGANIHGLDIYGRIPLFCAVQEDNAELVARMILLGSNITLVDENGDSPLHFAAQSHTQSGIHIISILLQRGARADIANREGYTPLHLLAKNATDAYLPIICKLLLRNENFVIKNKEGETPFDYAV